MDPLSALIALLIAAVFLVPALAWPTVGRGLVGLLFIGGAVFNVAYTLPNAPGSLEALVATTPVPLHAWVVQLVVAWNVAPLFVLLVAAFELAVGLLALWRGPLVRLALLGAGLWGIGMLPVVPPDGILVGVALTAAPGLAALLLLRHTCDRGVLGAAWARGSASEVRSDSPSAAARLRDAGAALPRPILSLLLFGAAWGLFLGVLHPWFMNWGATAEERAAVLPGDTAPPSAYFTRAITIDAPPAAVWPWLMQIGQDRAGFYSNDWLENLFGGDIHNAAELRPEWQGRAVGDKIPMAGEQLRRAGGEYTLLTVRLLEPERVYADVPGRFVLRPTGDGGTRLLLREALAIPERAGAMWLLWDPMHFVMEQRMLQGLKERVEGRPFVPPFVQATARVGWVVAGVGLLALFLRRRDWRAWLLAPAAVVALTLWLTGDLDSALAGALAVGITVGGALAFRWRWVWAYLPLASAVALVLLLAPDPYAVFGLLFLAIGGGAFGRVRGRPPFTRQRARPATA
jgi:hypothetical protein